MSYFNAEGAEVGRGRWGSREKHDLRPLVIHDNYLINLASCDEDLRSKSVAAFRGEIERALAIGAEYLVAHPGSCKGHTVEMAIYTFCRSLGEAAGLKTRGLKMLIENTAGAGQALGGKFEELAVMRQFAAEFTDLDIGFCIDTCHCLSSGYHIASDDRRGNRAASWNRSRGTRGCDRAPAFHRAP